MAVCLRHPSIFTSSACSAARGRWFALTALFSQYIYFSASQQRCLGRIAIGTSYDFRAQSLHAVRVVSGFFSPPYQFRSSVLRRAAQQIQELSRVALANVTTILCIVKLEQTRHAVPKSHTNHVLFVECAQPGSELWRALIGVFGIGLPATGRRDAASAIENLPYTLCSFSAAESARAWGRKIQALGELRDCGTQRET